MKINWFEQLLPLIGLVLFVAVLLRVDLKQLAVVLTNLNYFWIMGSLGLLVCSIVIRTIKWQILLEILEEKFGFWNLARAIIIGFYLGAITPAKVGDFGRAFFLGKHDYRHTIFSIFADRVLDILLLVATGSLAIVGGLFLFGFDPTASFFIVLLCWSIVAAFFFLKNKHRTAATFRPFFELLVPKVIKHKAKSAFDFFYSHVDVFRKKKNKIFVAMLLGSLNWILAIISAGFIALAIGINVPFWFFVIAIPFATLIEALPISISGLGTRETFFLVLFSFFSVAADQAIAFSLLYLTLASILPAFVGFLFFVRRATNLSYLLKEVFASF